MHTKCLILDLDNTLWDWFHSWHSGFHPFLKELERVTGLTEGEIIPKIKAIHERHRTSEYAHRLEELDFIEKNIASADLRKRYGTIFDAEIKGRRENLFLYDNVYETLLKLKSKGIRIVAFTDSMGLYTKERISKLNLDGIIDVVYTPKIPIESIDSIFEKAGLISVPDISLRITKIKDLGELDHKPNPKALLHIISDQDLEAADCMYVGDSLDRDIGMAQDAGVTDIWASYGKLIDPKEYELLKSVTHWPSQNVDREKQHDTSNKIIPTYTISDFSQILNICKIESKEVNEIELDMWKKAVDVQMHFNNMGMRVRHIYFTILSSLIAFYGVIIRENPIKVSLGFIDIAIQLSYLQL